MGLFKNRLGELLPGWKVILAIVLVVIFALVATNLISLVISLSLLVFGYSVVDFQANYFFMAIISQTGFLLGSLFAFKIFFRRPFRDIGLHRSKNSLSQMAIGLVFGAVSISSVYFVLLLSGHIEVIEVSFKNSNDLLVGLILFLVVGFSEEVLFRGYIMHVIDIFKKPWATVFFSSVLFSLAHIGNPNLTTLGLINIGFVGILFAQMFIKTKSLWMPIGYHITWNYFQGNILGLPVSGLDTSSIISSQVVKHDILSGGAFGPEGGLIVTFIIGLGFLFLKKITSSVNL
ncbi:CPBP family intramembrane metalloprotease [Alkalicella caledoniensis]|uniref:CPBP family intramembrane metalloprotease n=1 Tax=Alkalicella caledoniensis TaxID=2731377 RepID=A0A7G9WAQ4_ALKCA|nr:type II CAAX endopeptidase family protein [Alkalicella caledoniensis]QNO15766.1 CPBP family intramembrane metalloprotease [Alkalicella caledoniensis]